jgi:hypothetical protein
MLHSQNQAVRYDRRQGNLGEPEPARRRSQQKRCLSRRQELLGSFGKIRARPLRTGDFGRPVQKRRRSRGRNQGFHQRRRLWGRRTRLYGIGPYGFSEIGRREGWQLGGQERDAGTPLRGRGRRRRRGLRRKSWELWQFRRRSRNGLRIAVRTLFHRRRDLATALRADPVEHISYCEGKRQERRSGAHLTPSPEEP